MSALIVLAAAVLQGIFHTAQKPLLARYTGFEVTAYAMWAGTAFILPWTGSLLRALWGAGPQAGGAAISSADLAAEAVRSAAPAAARQGIAIDVSTGDGPPVPADHRRLTQVLDNLIANAVKFSHRNQRVLVTAGYDGRRWQIDVTDDGRLLVRLTAREVSVGGAPVALTPTEFRLLAALIRHPGQTLTPDQLLKLAWNDPLGVGPDRVKFGVMRLRRKLGQAAGEPGAAIEAVRGFGYRYVPPA